MAADKPENKKEEPAATKEASATKSPTVIELNLLNPTDAIRAAKTSLANEINILTDPQIGIISNDTRDALNKLLGKKTGELIISENPKSSGIDLYKFATTLHDHEDKDKLALTKSARTEIRAKIIDRISPTVRKTALDLGKKDTTTTEYSFAKSLDAIKEKMTADTKKEKEEAAEKSKVEAEKTEKETKHAALTHSDKAVMKMSSLAKDHPKINVVAGGAATLAAIAAFTSEAGRAAVAMIPSNFSAAAEQFLTNFPIVADYLQTLGTAVHTVSNGVGINALLGSFWGPIATGIAALPALGYARRKVLQSYGYTMPSYEGRMSALIGNTGHGLRLLTIDAALAPFRLGKFALQKIAKSKALKPTKLGVGAAAAGAVLAPLTGGTSLAVGGLGYVGGNLYSHHSKKDSHGDSSNSSGGRPGRDPGNDSD